MISPFKTACKTLSVTFGDSSPRGRAKGRCSTLRAELGSPFGRAKGVLFSCKANFCPAVGRVGALRANALLRAGFGYSSGITLQNTALALVEMV